MNFLLALFLALTEDMVAVPSGWFDRGCTPYVDCPIAYWMDSPRTHTYLSTFYIDRYETTAEDFAAFLDTQGEGVPYSAPTPGNYWREANEVVPNYGTIERYAGGHRAIAGFERYPANLVSWYGAAAYCAWKGKRLPTEAEWEKAERGTDYRLHPWGNEPANEMRARHFQTWPTTPSEGRALLIPVDALPLGDSPYGVRNMAGNVWEWVSDWYSGSYYPTAADHNPQGPVTPVPDGNGKVYRGLRGSSAVSHALEELTTPWRTPHEPWITSPAAGVRCAMSGP